MFKDAVTKILARPTVFISIIAVPAAIAAVASFLEPATDIDGNYIWESSAHVYQYTAIMIVFALSSMIMSIAATFATDNVALSANDAFKMAMEKAGKYFLMMLLASVVLIIAFLLLIIPGVWLSMSLMFASYFLVLRNTSAIESLKMSYRLVKGRWWRVFGKSLMFGLLYIAIAIPVFILLWVLGNFVGDEVSYAVESMIGVVGSLVTIVFMYEFFLDLEKTQGIQVQVAPATTEVPATPVATV
jgi:hypothetical protein